MTKTGIDDFLVKNGPQILPQLLNEAWRFDGLPCPRRVHLTDIEDAALGRKRLAIDLMVSAIDETYLLPKTIELECAPQKKKQRKSQLRLAARDGEAVEPEDASEPAPQPTCSHSGQNGGRWQFEITHPELLIEFTRISKQHLENRLSDLATVLCPHAYYRGTKARQTVTSFLASPKAQRLRARTIGGRVEVVDSVGRPFREKVLYFQGTLGKASRYFRGIGMAIPNPKHQEATAYLWSLTPIADDYETFTITPEIAKAFTVFQAAAGKVWEILQRILQDVTNHLTNIYGPHRLMSLLGKLLTFHSARQFRFDGEVLKRGWVEMLEVGDTGQGKTQQVDRLTEATGMGEGVDGVSTTRTGLAYSFQKHNDSWFLVWGKYPLNDGKLLFIDEAQNLQPEDIDKIRKGRSDGVIAADGVRSGEHPTRTRLIATANPRHQGVVDDQLFGIELVKQMFKDEDVRRFDFAVISSSSDDKADINRPRAEVQRDEQRITAEILSASVKWAWSRGVDQIVFTNDGTSAVYQVARDLSELYGEARDIPLMIEADARHKVARIAVAVAALLHSTDPSHERVIVTAEHVEAVRVFLTSVYNHPNCSFDLYARIRRDEAALSDEEYSAIWEALRDCDVDHYEVEGQVRGIPLGEEDRATLLRAFMQHGGLISRQDLAGELGKTPAWTSKVVRVLKANRLIRVSRGRTGGYQATPKFNKFLKLAIGRKDLET